MVSADGNTNQVPGFKSEVAETDDSNVEAMRTEVSPQLNAEEERLDTEEEVAQSDRSASLISEILRIASATDRGRVATPTQVNAIDLALEELESINPTPNPTTSDFIIGTWDLLYSTTQPFRSSPFFMAGRAVCDTEEQARQYDWFCDMHRAALAISNVGSVRQIISSNRMVSEFEVSVGSVPFLPDFTPFRYSGGMPLTIEGAIVSSADITSTTSGNSWEIFMDTVEIKGSNIPLLRNILDAGLKLQSRGLGNFLENNVPSYTNPRPMFETTYLDSSTRVSRDQDGKVFVYGKSSSKTEPTDYSGVDADLGILNLLEGFNDSVTKFYL